MKMTSDPNTETPTPVPSTDPQDEIPDISNRKALKLMLTEILAQTDAGNYGLAMQFSYKSALLIRKIAEQGPTASLRQVTVTPPEPKLVVPG